MITEIDDNLNSLIAVCADALRLGQHAKCQQLIADNAKYQRELEEFLAGYKRVDDEFSHLRGVVSPQNASTAPTMLQGDTLAFAMPAGTEFGDYELLREIARGGMGVVYSARQRSLNRIVALKILPVQGANFPDAARFLAETQAIAQLAHDQIVPIYELGEHEGFLYFTMKYLAGGSVGEHRDEFRSDPRTIASLMINVAAGVEHAHRRGILHRDLKPANLLLDEQGRVSVADFGLAKQLHRKSDLTLAGTIVGTPSYMAPEQACPTGELTTACDVYGMGAILYELLSGRPPFCGASPTETLLQVISQDPVPLRELVPDVDRDLSVICSKCLSKVPSARYGSAEAFGEDLQRWLDGKPILAKPGTLRERSVKWAKRRPTVAALLLLLAVSSITVGAGVSAFAVEAAQRAETEERLKNEAEQREQEALVAETAERRLRQLAQQRQKESNWRAYAAQVQSIAHLWRDGHLGQVDRLFTETTPQRGEPDFRGWEWFYLKQQLGQQQSALPGQYGVAMDWHAESGLLAVDDRGLHIEIWNVKLMKRVNVIKIPERVYSLAWSEDGQWIAAGTAKDAVLLLDPATGQLVHTLRFQGAPISDLAWRPGHNEIAVAPWSAETILFDAKTGETLRTFPKKFSNDLAAALAWTPDGNQLAIGGRFGWVRLFDREGEQPLWLKKYTDKVVNSLAWNLSGNLLAVGLAGGQLITVNPHGEKQIELGGHPGVHLNHLVWQDDQHLLSGADDQLVKYWDTTTGEKLGTFQLHASPVHALGLSPDRNTIAATAPGLPVKFAPLASDQKSVRVFTKHEREITSLRWNHRGDRFVTTALDGKVCLWNSITGEVEQTFIAENGNRWVTGAAWSPDDKLLAVTDHSGRLTLWNIPDGTQVKSVRCGGDEWYTVSWSRDGQTLLISGAHSDAIHLRDAGTLETLASMKNSSAFYQARWSPDGRWICARNTQPRLGLWDNRTGEHLWLSDEHNESFVWGSDSRLLVGAGRVGELLFYDVRDKPRLIHQAFGHNGPVQSLAWSPHETRIVSCGTDATIRIWDTATADLLLTLSTGNETPLTCIAWSPDGLRVTAGDRSGQVYLWGSKDLPLPRQPPDYLETGTIFKQRNSPPVP